MADDLENDSDLRGDKWLSNWESNAIDEWEQDFDMDDRTHTESERSLQNLWMSFQNSASSIARLYKEGSQGNNVSLWVPFQNSASCVTILHKDSQEAMKKAFDLGCQHGSQRKTKDLFSWIRKKRRHIRREDLIAFLCGKNAPVRHHHLHKSSTSLSRTPTRVSVGMDRSCSPRHAGAVGSEHKHEDTEPDLQPFREALALQGLNGAMSNISVGRAGSQLSGSPHQGSPSARGASVDATNGAGAERDDFHYYILEEMARRCDTRKRASATDTRIDSPSRKRSRLWHDPDAEDI